MALPFKLKDLMVFQNGINYRGQVASVTLPKLTMKIEEWRGAGMATAFPVTNGMDGLMEMEHEWGGPMREVIAQFGIGATAADFTRFSGAYQAEDTGEVVAIDITTRGVIEEIDMGEAKPGESAPMKTKSKLGYYRLDWNGATLIEIDPLAGIMVVAGVDRWADIRAALGS